MRCCLAALFLFVALEATWQWFDSGIFVRAVDRVRTRRQIGRCGVSIVSKQRVLLKFSSSYVCTSYTCLAPWLARTIDCLIECDPCDEFRRENRVVVLYVVPVPDLNFNEWFIRLTQYVTQKLSKDRHSPHGHQAKTAKKARRGQFQKMWETHCNGVRIQQTEKQIHWSIAR